MVFVCEGGRDGGGVEGSTPGTYTMIIHQQDGLSRSVPVWSVQGGGVEGSAPGTYTMINTDRMVYLGQ